MDAWWRAANYLSVGQVCLLASQPDRPSRAVLRAVRDRPRSRHLAIDVIEVKDRRWPDGAA
jgi:phosphoketolase